MQEKTNLEIQILQLNHQNEELKMKSVLLMTEIERLHSIIHEKEKEGDTLRETMNEIEIQNFNKIQDMKKQVENVIREKLVRNKKRKMIQNNLVDRGNSPRNSAMARRKENFRV